MSTSKILGTHGFFDRDSCEAKIGRVDGKGNWGGEGGRGGGRGFLERRKRKQSEFMVQNAGRSTAFDCAAPGEANHRGRRSFLPQQVMIAAAVITLNTCLVEIFTQIWWMSCRWPKPDDTLHTRVAVVADPQLTDRTSYGFASEGVALWAVTTLCDMYLSRAFSMIRSLDPEAVVFMGDLMDGARHYGPEEFETQYERFRRIARLKEGTPELHVAGNHDIGLGNSLCVSCAQRYKRSISPLNYKLSVGNVTFVAIDTVSTAGSMDAFSCMAHRHFRREAYSFTSKLSGGRVSIDWRGIVSPGQSEGGGNPQGGGQREGAGSQDKNRQREMLAGEDGEGGTPRVRHRDVEEEECRPRILLTHIPLWRPVGTGCGDVGRAPDNREIAYMLRYTFQTTVSEELSAAILKASRPDLVLSGDDHDHCLVEHPAPWRTGKRFDDSPRLWGSSVSGRGVEERTVGTASMLQGNKYPSIALLTIDQAAASRRVDRCRQSSRGPGFTEESVVDYHVCVLPPQLLIYYEVVAIVLVCAVGLLLSRLSAALKTSPVSPSMAHLALRLPANLLTGVTLTLLDVICVVFMTVPVFLAIRLVGTYLV